MSDIPFYRTQLGHRCYEATAPSLVRELARLNENLERLLTIVERDAKITASVHVEHRAGHDALDLTVTAAAGLPRMDKLPEGARGGRWPGSRGPVRPRGGQRRRAPVRSAYVMLTQTVKMWLLKKAWI